MTSHSVDKSILLYSQIKTSDLIGRLAVRPKPYWTAKRCIGPENRRPTSINKKNGRQKFLSKLWFFEGKLYLKWDRGIGKYSGRIRKKIPENTYHSVKYPFAQYQSLVLWLYNKALIDQLVQSIREIFGPLFFVRTSLRLVRTSKLRSKYFPVCTSQLVNKSIVFRACFERQTCKSVGREMFEWESSTVNVCRKSIENLTKTLREYVEFY